MPVTRLLPVAWYETPNIHHVTVSDFRDLVRAKGINVESVWHLSGAKPASDAAASWRAEHEIFLISRYIRRPSSALSRASHSSSARYARTSVVAGKSVTVRVSLGGRRKIKKKTYRH